MPVETILLDAFGTFLFPVKPIAQIYRDVAATVGIDRNTEEIAARFGPAFSKHFRQWKSARFPDNSLGAWQIRWTADPSGTIEKWNQQSLNQQLEDWVPSCDEANDANRWRCLIADVFDLPADEDSNTLSDLFEGLWNQFAKPECWKLADSFPQLLSWAATKNLRLAVASNFDQRLRPVLEGLLESQQLTNDITVRNIPTYISTEIGHPKPSPKFYHSILEQLQSTPDRLCMVGDSWCEDVAVPSAMGIRSYWVNPTATMVNQHVIKQVSDLISLPIEI